MKKKIEDFQLTLTDLATAELPLALPPLPLEEKGLGYFELDTSPDLHSPEIKSPQDDKLISTSKKKKRGLSATNIEDLREGDPFKKRMISHAELLFSNLVNQSKFLTKLFNVYNKTGAADLQKAISGLTNLEKIKLDCFKVQTWIIALTAIKTMEHSILKQLWEKYDKIAEIDEAADVCSSLSQEIEKLDSAIDQNDRKLTVFRSQYQELRTLFKQQKTLHQKNAINSTPSFTRSPGL
jgi:hypothetical protein